MGTAAPRWPRAAGAAAVALAATLVFFHRAVLGGEIFIARDILRVYYPLHQYWAERVSRGEFPGWFPYDGLGEPFAGMLIAGAFHPLNALYLALGLPAAMTVNVLTCFPLAFLGVYGFARRWALEPASAALAAVVFSFGGYLVCITNNLPYLMAAASGPCALWASDRFFDVPSAGRAVVAACLLALVLFAGDPQGFVVAGAATVLIGIARRGLWRSLGPAAGLLALTALLAAVQILPALQVAREGKPASQTLAAAEAWSVHPLRALEVGLGPLFASESGDPIGAAIDRNLLKTSRNNLWVNSLHVGVPALVFLGVALGRSARRRAVWLLAGWVVCLALLALGKHAPVYGLLFGLVPPWRAFRYPEKLVPWVTLGLALGAAAGLDAVQSDARLRRRAVVALGAAVVVCVGLIALERAVGLFSLLVAALWQGTPPRAALARLSATFMRRALESGAAAFLVLLALLVARPKLRGALVVALVFLHLWAVNGAFQEVVTPAVLHPGAFAEAIERVEGPPRLGSWRVYRLKGGYGTDYERDAELAPLGERARFARSVETGLDPVTPALWGLEGANEYLPGVSRRIADLAEDEGEFAARYASLFGARWVSVSREDAEDVARPGMELVAEHQPLELQLFRDAAARPRAYLARARCVAGPAGAFRMLSRGVPDGEAVVECPHPLPLPATGTSAGDATIVSYAPERVEVRVAARAHALLVLNDAFYRGWSARVDGRPETILPTNYGVRGVPLAPGEHLVSFVYRTPGLALGAWVSAVSLLGSAALALARR